MKRRQKLARLTAMILASVPGLGRSSDRVLSITDFERVRVSGAMTVVVRKSYATSVRISGDSHDLERMIARVSNGVLVVESNAFVWGSGAVAHGPLTVYITTPHLRAVALNGSGRIDVDYVQAPHVELSLVGAGELRVAHLITEAATLLAIGAGRLTVSGTAAQAHLSAQGSSTLDAAALTVEDATITAFGTATVTATAHRSADLTATGTSSINVGGHPACSVHNTSGGTIICGG